LSDKHQVCVEKQVVVNDTFSTQKVLLTAIEGAVDEVL